MLGIAMGNKPGAFDLSLRSPLNSKGLHEVGLCRERGWICAPMVVEGYGAWDMD